MMRLDKILAHSGFGTRSEVKKIIKKGLVLINGEVIKDDGFKVHELEDEIFVEGFELEYKKEIYIMLNKPSGYVSATFDLHQKTVLDLMEEYHFMHLFPVGRLDIDTVGLLLLTNDGALAHRLLAPKNGIKKTYYAEINKDLTSIDQIAFAKGIILEDGYQCLPAELNFEIINSRIAYVTICEGKFHQVKRMFQSLGKEVLYLKRLTFASLQLDVSLKEGKYRELTEEELKLLKNI